jgi:DNA-binding NarL/FixJ family response regulator
LAPEEVVGRSVFTLFAVAPRLLDGVRRALAGEDCTVTVALGEIVLEARHTPVRDDTGAIAEVLGVAADVTERTRAAAGLTPTEHRVLRLLAGSLTYREIGTRLHVSWETVRKHVQGIADAFGIPAERAGVVTAARERGLL